MPHHSALRCVSHIRQNNAKPLISNGLRFIVTCLLMAALGVLFHVARYTFATTVLLANEVPIESVSKMLGHSRIQITQLYAKILNSSIEKQAERLAEIL